MVKQALLIIFITCFVFFPQTPASATKLSTLGTPCKNQDGTPQINPADQSVDYCDPDANLVCLPGNSPKPGWYCTLGNPTSKVFGLIKPPDALINIPYGSAGISRILSNIVSVIYAISALIVIFMFFFGALEWILSGGDKEKVASARGRITAAIIGVVLLAIAFPILKLLGQVTGFALF